MTQNQTHQISTLSSKAKLKGKLLYYSLILQSLNFIFLGLAANSRGENPIFYMLISAVSLLSLYKLRPRKIQNLIDKLQEKNKFPIKPNSVKLLRISLTLMLLMSLAQMLFEQRPIEIQSVLMMLISIPILVFIYDKELTDFIWVNQKP